MIDTVEVVERVFRPGNLVHGTKIHKFPGLVNQGLKPGWLVDGRSISYDICFAMLSQIQPLDERYYTAQHDGARDLRTRDWDFPGPLENISVVVSREKLIDRFPTQLSAVGDVFWQQRLADIKSRLFGGQLTSDSAYGIPIRIPLKRPYFDEVELTLPNDITSNVPMEMWEALVIRRENLAYFKRIIAKAEIHLPGDLPIFSPTIELLSAGSERIEEVGLEP